MRRERAVCGWIFAVAWLLAWCVPGVARADELVVQTVEVGDWSTSIAALQADVRAEGRALHVVVQDRHGQRAACGDYVLRLDDIGRQAFAVLGCEAGATAVRLVRRAALFEHGDVVPVPRLVGITAVETRTGGARGGAASVGGSDVACTVSVRPYLRDLEHGTVVYLTPGRFVLNVRGAALTAGVSAAVSAPGWLLRGNVQGTLQVEYDVTDTLTGHVVTHERATLSCGAQGLDGAGAPIAAAPVATAVTAAEGRAVRVGGAVRDTTRGAVDRQSGSCGGAMAGDRTVPLQVGATTRVQVRVDARYPAVVYLRARGGPREPELACVRANGANLAVIDRVLRAGDYDVVVDGMPNAEGDFTLHAESVPLDAPQMDPRVQSELTLGSTVQGDTRRGASQDHGSCVGGAAPELVYRLHLAQRSFVMVDMASDYDGALYLRGSLESAATELACNDDYGDTRHARLARDLGPGDYDLFVDGYGENAGTFTLRVTGMTADEAAARAVVGHLALGENEATLHPGFALYGRPCGGSGAQAVYELVVARPSFVTVRLSAGYDAAVSVRRALTTDRPGATSCGAMGHLSQVSERFAPGRYFVVVDGGRSDVSGAFSLHVAMDDATTVPTAM